MLSHLSLQEFVSTEFEQSSTGVINYLQQSDKLPINVNDVRSAIQENDDLKPIINFLNIW